MAGLAYKSAAFLVQNECDSSWKQQKVFEITMFYFFEKRVPLRYKAGS